MLATDQSDERVSVSTVRNPWSHGARRVPGGVRRALWVAFRVNSGKHRRADSSCRHGMTFSPKAGVIQQIITAVCRSCGTVRSVPVFRERAGIRLYEVESGRVVGLFGA